MTIKLKDLLAPAASPAIQNPQRSGKKLFREFVLEATSLESREDPFWEELRKKTMPTQFGTVEQMFARWKGLAGIKPKQDK